MILPLKKLAKSAFVELKKIQTGEKKLVKTGEEMIDCHIGGLLPGDVVVVSALSGFGKSETLYTLRDNILNTEINVNADKFVFLDYSFEMKMLNKILRGVNKKTGKKKQEILFTEFTDSEKELVNEYYKTLIDDRQFVCQEPITPANFYTITSEFLEEHQDKDAVFVSADHTLLFEGSDKKNVIESLIESVNKLKLEYDNVYFILISQMNRSLLERIKDKDNHAAPMVSDIFGSSFVDQISSYNIALTNPYKLGINEYMKVKADRYDYLEEDFADMPDAKGKISFSTFGKLFYHVLKVRESDHMFRDIFIKNMTLTGEDLKMKPKPKQLELPNFELL